eukprot:c23318_g1_i1 orf=127-1407(-)
MKMRHWKHSETSRVSKLTILFILASAVFVLSFFSSTLLQGPLLTHNRLQPTKLTSPICSAVAANSVKNRCDFAKGKWVFDSARQPVYGEACPFQRNAWNCGKNKRPGLEDMYKWRWAPHNCRLPTIEPAAFLSSIRNLNLGFVGDSLNENLLVSLLCILATADPGSHRWKKKKAWRGAYFPKYNVTVGYHRAVLLADYHEWKATNASEPLEKLGFTRGFQVNVDLPASDWINVTEFYDIVIFNTGHWWGFDKFPPDNPLLFHKQGEPIIPPLDLRDGLKVVLEHMISYAERAFPSKVMKIWRTQSPRHFEGGDWNQNGSCLSNRLLNDSQVAEWFGLGKGGVNREARELNAIILHALKGSSFQLLDVSHLSEYRSDAHPAIWLGQKDAHVIWGQDCMHWCLPGIPDTWVNIFMAMALQFLHSERVC